MPESLNEETVLLRKVTLLRKLGGSFWRSATVLEDVVDQRLFVMNIKFGRHDKVEQSSKVCVGLWRIDLGYWRGQFSQYEAASA